MMFQLDGIEDEWDGVDLPEGRTKFVIEVDFAKILEFLEQIANQPLTDAADVQP